MDEIDFMMSVLEDMTDEELRIYSEAIEAEEMAVRERKNDDE